MNLSLDSGSINYSLILTVLLCALPVFGAFLGYVRGAKKSFARLVTVLLAFAAVYMFTPVLSEMILDLPMSTFASTLPTGEAAANMTIEEYLIYLLNSTEATKKIFEYAPSLVDFIVAIPTVVLSILLFVVVFFALKNVLWVVFAIFSAIFLRTKKGKNRHRIIGAVFGLVQGAVCTFVLLVPIMGLLTFTSATTHTLDDPAFEEIPQVVSFAHTANTYIDPLNNSSAMKFLQKTKINLLTQNAFNKLQTVKVGTNDSVLLLDELKDSVLPMSADLIKFATTDMTASSPEDIMNLVASMADSPMGAQIMSEFVSNAAADIKAGETVMGIDFSSVNANPDSEESKVLNDILGSMETASPETISNDMSVVTDVLDIVSEYKEANPETANADTLAVFTELAKDPEYNAKIIEAISSVENSSFAGKGLEEKIAALAASGVVPPPAE